MVGGVPIQTGPGESDARAEGTVFDNPSTALIQVPGNGIDQRHLKFESGFVAIDPSLTQTLEDCRDVLVLELYRTFGATNPSWRVRLRAALLNLLPANSSESMKK